MPSPHSTMRSPVEELPSTVVPPSVSRSPVLPLPPSVLTVPTVVTSPLLLLSTPVLPCSPVLPLLASLLPLDPEAVVGSSPLLPVAWLEPSSLLLLLLLLLLLPVVVSSWSELVDALGSIGPELPLPGIAAGSEHAATAATIANQPTRIPSIAPVLVTAGGTWFGRERAFFSRTRRVIPAAAAAGWVRSRGSR